MLKFIGAVVVIGAVVAAGAAAVNRWYNKTERETVETLTGQGGEQDQ